MPLSYRAATGRLVLKIGLRSHRHHQQRGSCAPGQPERNETPDPVRSDAVKPRIQCLRQRTDHHDQLKLTGNTVLVVLM